MVSRLFPVGFRCLMPVINNRSQLREQLLQSVKVAYAFAAFDLTFFVLQEPLLMFCIALLIIFA